MIKNEEKLYEYANKNNIIICYEKNLAKFNKSALYCNINNKDLILLSDLYNEKELEERIDILSEEIGHYKTSYGDDFKPEYNNANDKINHNKNELRACRSGLEVLVDIETLKNAFLKAATPDDVIEATGLPINIINKHLYFQSLSNRYFVLSKNKALDLNKLPGWIIVDI